jgi:phosphoenolpyruvate-protein kinase (PTS system EI component)
LIAFLLGIGVRSFSASPHMLPQLQTLILEQNTVSAKNLAAKLLQQTTIQAVENIIQDYFRLDIDPKGGFHYDPKSAGAHR